MNKLTISNLIMLILNEENTSILRNDALKELKKRAYKYGLDYNELIEMDEENVFKRGFETQNYLFSRNVDMQKLMNTYFDNIYSDDNRLLLSETYLCNRLGEFFDKIVLKELSNISKRLKNNNISISDKQRLLKVKEILSDRRIIKPIRLYFYHDIYMKLDKLTYNFDCNELLKNEVFSNIELMRRAMLGSFIDNDLVKYFHINNIIKSEAKKLKVQKKKLLTQVREGYKVDYYSSEIDSAITKR